jgi:hypothetical protein
MAYRLFFERDQILWQHRRIVIGIWIYVLSIGMPCTAYVLLFQGLERVLDLEFPILILFTATMTPLFFSYYRLILVEDRARRRLMGN